MGCRVSRLELRGRSAETGLRSISNKIVDDISRRDRAMLINHSSDTAKLLVTESVGQNSVALEKKDIVLDGANELLIPPQERLTDPSYHAPKDYKSSPLLDGCGSKTKLDPVKTEISRGVEAKQTKSTDDEENIDEELEGGGGGGSVIPDFDCSLWVASPSFREYCVPDGDSDDDSAMGIAVIVEDNVDPEKRINGETVTQQDIIEVPIRGNRVREQDDSSGRSVKRRRNLRKVLTVRRPAAVRNLFSVGTCYNRLVPSSHNGPRKSHAKEV